MTRSAKRSRRSFRYTFAAGASVVTLLLLVGCGIIAPGGSEMSPTDSARPTPEESVDEDAASAMNDVIVKKMAEWRMRSVIVRARRDGKLSTWLPSVPHSDQVTLGQLAQMTSGYPDYLWDPEMLHLLNEDTFRQWSAEELAAFATAKPLLYEPGTNWNYSHTAYVLLGMALEKITGGSVSDLLDERILWPLELTATGDPGTAAIPGPVLHTYTAERRMFFGIPAEVPFMEDATFWNPSWTITRGAVQYTNIFDMVRTAEAIGSGELLTPEMHELQLNVDTRKFARPLDGCPACFAHSEVYTYGVGVVLMGDWVVQNPMFRGTAAVAAFLPGDDVAIAVAVTFEDDAFDEEGDVTNRATDLFRELAGHRG